MRPSRLTLLTIAYCTCALIGVGAQSDATKSKTKPPKNITLSGCVERDQKTPDQFTIRDAKQHRTFRLTGFDLREYLDKPVQVDGGLVVKGVTIKGGLTPTPNVAAQAGAMDPSRAAVAAQTQATGTGSDEEMQEFLVKAVRAMSGTCK